MTPKTDNGVYFIAEIGQNHQGDIEIAKKMVDVFAAFGISAIKTAKRDIDQCSGVRQNPDMSNSRANVSVIPRPITP